MFKFFNKLWGGIKSAAAATLRGVLSIFPNSRTDIDKDGNATVTLMSPFETFWHAWSTTVVTVVSVIIITAYCFGYSVTLVVA